MVYNKTSSNQKLSELDNWLFVNDALDKKFTFNSFTSALHFINSIGSLAEKYNHHPEIYNIYNKVHLRIHTLEVGGVTDKDFDLAKAIDGIS